MRRNARCGVRCRVLANIRAKRDCLRILDLNRLSLKDAGVQEIRSSPSCSRCSETELNYAQGKANLGMYVTGGTAVRATCRGARSHGYTSGLTRLGQGFRQRASLVDVERTRDMRCTANDPWVAVSQASCGPNSIIQS